MTAIVAAKSLFSRNNNILQHSMGRLSGKRRILATLSLLFLLLMAEAVMAVPACPRGVNVTQPDGAEITIYLRGDEHSHWYENDSGFLITKNKARKEWVYMVEDAGRTVASKYAVGKADPAAIGGLKPSKEKLSAIAERSRAQKSLPAEQPSYTPLTGTMYNLVILVNFSDSTVAYSRQAYDDLFNQVGYTADGAAGSVKDYYHQISYNSLTVQSTVVEAVTLDYGYAYYGANDAFGNDIRPREMVEQALAKLEARGFDFSTMDGDSDGWVDGLTIIHAGGGEEFGGNDSSYIWSHKWDLISTVTYDGVSMQTYHTEPARRGWDDSPSSWGITRIGVICHENGHFLGLPDLYDYDYDSAGAGNFCLMAGGSWNGNDGTSPAHMSAWCKCNLGWVSPTVISSSGTNSLGQVETNSQVFKLQGAFPSNEYFLVENRQGWGFDSGLPGTQRGILIWHVDESQSTNDDQTHYKVDLEEASGTQHLELNINDGDDADYFRSGNATAFTGSTVPNNLSYASQPLNINITNVGATSASMSVTFTSSLTLSISSITPNTGQSGSTVNITNLAGTAFQSGAGVRLTRAGQPDIVATNVSVVSGGQITCTFSLAGAATGAWNVRVTNPDAQWVELTNGFNVNPQGVFLTENFESAFVNGDPPGWSKSFQTASLDWVRNSGDYNGGGAHGGNYNAMLFVESTAFHETYLITPAINFPAGTTSTTLEFWHKQEIWPSDQDTLKVYYKIGAGGSWSLLASYTTNVPSWTKRTISLPNPGSNYYIGFLGNAKWGYGVCIDDVSITGIIPQQRTLTISSTSGGHTDPSAGGHQYTSGIVVNINAIPDSGYQFVNWTGSGVTAGKVANPNAANTTITMDADLGVTANFTVSSYTLSVNSSGASGVSISSSTGHGGTTNYARSITSGTGVTLTAPTTAGGNDFTGWTGDVTDINRTISFAMNGNKNVTAHFATLTPAIHTEPTLTPGLCNKISWDSVPLAKAYYAECSSDPSFLFVDYSSGWITGTFYQFCGLNTCQEYWYRVKSGLSGWSQTSQAEFQNDTFTDTMATSGGDVVLAAGGTDVVGGTSFSGGTSTESYLNGFLVTTGTTMTQIEVYLDISSSCSIEFVVYEGGFSFSDQYNRIHSSTLADSGTGAKFYSSGPISISLQAGRYYMIGAVYSGPVTIYYDDIASSPPFADHTGWGYYYGFPSPGILSDIFNDSLTFYHRYTTAQATGSGSVVSTPINLPAGGSWGAADFNTTILPDTELTFDVLPAAGTTPIAGYENISSGAVLSGIGATTIRLRANLSTNDEDYTPVLHDWSVTYANPAGIESSWSSIEYSVQVTPGDFEPDCDVDLFDFVILASQWRQSPGDPSADIAPLSEGDGKVNYLDFAEFAEHWLEGY